jgi:hypothetical protein
MDIDINKMFKEKNKEIFNNNLTLEMERNLDALKNTTDNCVSLEINKLFLFFKKFFEENKIDYKKEELLGLLYRERKILNDIVNNKIEEKKNNIKQNILNNNQKEDILSEEFLNKYFEALKDESNNINDNIEILLKEEICTNFSSNLIKKFKLDNGDQLDRINSRINILFKDNVISRVKDQIIFRDDSLKNMAKESFNKYLDLTNKTVE